MAAKNTPNEHPTPAPKATLELLAREVRETNRGVQELGRGQARLEEQVRGVDKRVDKVERAISTGHGCTQQERLAKLETKQDSLDDKLNKDINKGVETFASLKTMVSEVGELKEDYEDEKKTSRSTRFQAGMTALGLIVTVLIAAVGSIWFLGGANAASTIDREQNARAHKTLTDGINTNNKSIQEIGASVDRRLSVIENTLTKDAPARPDDFERAYLKLSPIEQERVKRSLPPELRYTLPR